jgi:hypothetical protein
MVTSSPALTALGLFFRGACFLNAWELRLNGQACASLLANAANGADAAFELTNPDVQLADGRTRPKERLSLRRAHDLRDTAQMTLARHSLGGEAIACDLTLAAANEFYDMFTIRGTQIKQRGVVHSPRTHGEHQLALAYDGADGHYRSTTLTFDPPPDTVEQGVATFHIALKPRARQDPRSRGRRPPRRRTLHPHDAQWRAPGDSRRAGPTADRQQRQRAF